MVYKMILSDRAKRSIQGLDRHIGAQILKKLYEIIKLPDPLSKAKKLKNMEIETYRFRIGEYRAVFTKNIETNEIVVLIVLRVAHRKDIYRKN